MAILRQRWFLDVPGQRFVRDLLSNLDAVLPPFTQGDTLDLEIHTVEPTGTGAFRYVDASGLTCKVGIFDLEDSPPTEGTIKWGYDGDWTAALAFDASAAVVAAALNALASITAAGGVTVTLSSAGQYGFAFTLAGAREFILADAEDAYPSTFAKSRRKIVGDVDTKEVQRVTLRSNPAAGQNTWAALPTPVASVTVLSVGSNQVQGLNFSSLPAGGQLLLDYDGTTAVLPTTGEASDLVSALEAIPAVGDGNVSVTGDFANGFVIVFGGLTAGDVVALVPDSSGLLAAQGKKAKIEIEGPEVDDLLGDDDSVNVLLEVEMKEGSDPHTLLQLEIPLRNGRLEPESDTRPPADRILGPTELAKLFPLGQIVTAALTISQATVDFDLTAWALDDPASLAFGLGIMKPNAGADGIFFTGVVVVDADTIRGYLNTAPTEAGYTAAVLFRP